MKKLLFVFLLGALTAGGLFAGANYHFILTSDGMVIERKTETGFEDTFADTRSWGPLDYLKRPAIAKALARHGVNELFSKDTVDKGKDAIDQSLESSKKAIDSGIDKLRDAVK